MTDPRIPGAATCPLGYSRRHWRDHGTLRIPDHLKELIDRQIAEGRAASEADYIVEALRAYAEHIEAESEIAATVGRADTDMAAGRFVTVTGAEDSEALHARAMDRLHARMPGDTQEH